MQLGNPWPSAMSSLVHVGSEYTLALEAMVLKNVVTHGRVPSNALSDV